MTDAAPALPRYIALCGHPKAGKSVAQKILERDYGYEPVDDGFPLRDIAVRHFGLTERQVYTQEGKAETVAIAGQDYVVRDVLGTLGNKIEEMFGSHAIPIFAIHRCELQPEKRFSFGSVRRDQGIVYKERGGLIIEIRNPLAGPSPYEFDRYDASLADAVIFNNGLARDMHPEEALEDLRLKIAAVLSEAA